MQSWDCSQVESEDEEDSWQEGDQMAEQWEEEQRLEDVVERRRMEGSSLKLDAMQKVHKRMSQGNRVKSHPKRRKYQDGLSKK